MKNELGHIINKYFSSEKYQVTYANIDAEAKAFCKTLFDILDILVEFDHPDFYAKKDNDVYVFEHFMVDASEVKNNGSLERKETSRIKNRVNKYFTEDKKGHISDKIDNKANFENFKNNFSNNYDKHVKKIPDYISTLRNTGIINKNSKVKTIFFIENSSILGNYVNTGDKIQPFIPFTAEFFIQLLEKYSELPDYIIYAQETQNSNLVVIMSTVQLEVYKQNITEVASEDFIAFSPYTIQKRFFIDKKDVIWKNTTLGEVVNFRRGHDLPRKDMIEGNIPVVGSNGIIGYHNEYTTKSPCITIGRSGNVGLPFMVKQDCWAHNTTLYIDDFKRNDPEFIYYFLQTLNLDNYRGGSAVPTLNRNHIHPIDVRIPDVPTQRRIAGILSALDDKIENNRKICDTLEQIAQAIFKHWFVDFDFPDEQGRPYKSSSGKMVENELGLIPEGWEIVPFNELISIRSGNRPKNNFKEKSIDMKIPLVGASSIMGYTNGYNFNEAVLVIGRVGTHGVVQKYFDKIWASDNTLVIKSDYFEYTYQILLNINYSALNKGSTQPLITQTDIKNLPIVKPSITLLNRFEEMINSLAYERQIAENQNDILQQTRDTLLPKLMSGEVEV